MRKREFGAVRRDSGPRSRWLDLHNLMGIAKLLWANRFTEFTRAATQLTARLVQPILVDAATALVSAAVAAVGLAP
jgi:hypothetical protein